MHRDVLNNYLNVGDIVVYGDQETDTHLGYIMKFCPTKVKIRCLYISLEQKLIMIVNQCRFMNLVLVLDMQINWSR